MRLASNSYHYYCRLSKPLSVNTRLKNSWTTQASQKMHIASEGAWRNYYSVMCKTWQHAVRQSWTHYLPLHKNNSWLYFAFVWEAFIALSALTPHVWWPGSSSHTSLGYFLPQGMEDTGIWAVHRTWQLLYPRILLGMVELPLSLVRCPSGGAAGVNTQLPTLNRRSANVNLGGLTLNKATWSTFMSPHTTRLHHSGTWS